jgi:hypothetical protein
MKQFFASNQLFSRRFRSGLLDLIASSARSGNVVIALPREAPGEASDFLVFLAVAEDAGGLDAAPELRRLSRLLAWTTLELLDELESERSARIAIQVSAGQAPLDHWGVPPYRHSQDDSPSGPTTQ